MRKSLLLFLLLSACIDPLVVKIPSVTSKLVVDGLITNDPGPYEVKLFYSSDLETRISEPRVEPGAQVWIFDDLGQTEQLTEATPGVYRTNPSGIQGQLGRSYSLKIKTRDALDYQSAPQRLLPAGEIDSISVKFEKDGLLLDDLSTQDAFSVFIDARGVANNSNLFRWRSTGTYKVKTFPELRQIMLRDGPIPDPDPCSGYILRQGMLYQVAPCTCCICWTAEASTRAVVSENRNISDLIFNKIELAKLPANTIRFYEKYYIEVEQLSVTADVYEFWNLVVAQQKAAGSLFQPNSVRVRGNVACVSDPEQEVLGVFSVSGITRKSIFIDRSQVPFELPPLTVIPFSCLEVLQNGTTQKPPFW